MKRTVARGFLWVTTTMALVRAMRYLAYLFLGGILAPVDFGGFAAIFVLVNGLALFQGFGLGPALLFRRHRVSESADAIFLLTCVLGAGFYVVAFLAAPLVELIFRQPGLAAPFRVCALIIPIRAVMTVPLRLFEKELDFRKKFLPGIAGSGAYAAATLTLALAGFGVWALVAGEVASVAAEGAVYWISSTWRPRFRFDPRSAREDLRFGWMVIGGTMLVFLFQGVDRVAVSRFIDTYALGLYAFAFTLGTIPSSYVVRSLNTVLLPSYTSARDRPDKQRELYFLSTSGACAVGVLFLIGVAFLGRPFLAAAYGMKWLGAAGAFSVLALLGLFDSLHSLNEDVIVALGRPSIFRRLNALRVGVAVAGLWFGARWAGITGVALVMASATLVSLAAGWLTVRALLGASGAEFRRAVSAPLGAGAVAAAAAWAARPLVGGAASLPAVASAGGGLVILYGAAWLALDGRVRRALRAVLAGAGEAGKGGA
jgi:O-antigen/teichoic acid export membrane protein